MLPPVMVTLSKFCDAIVPSSGCGAKSARLYRLISTMISSIVRVGGPTNKSVMLVGLVPPPVRLNRFKKNRYHSRDNSPVTGSVTGVRGAGMVVTLSGLGTGWVYQQFGAKNSNLDRISARHLIHAVA
jgi:hypothetical protein